MAAVKTESVTFRILPETKAALRQAAQRERRSLAKRLEVMIEDWCGREGIAPLVCQPAKAEIDEAAWDGLYRTQSRPFPRPETGKVALKVINHDGDEVLKVFEVR